MYSRLLLEMDAIENDGNRFGVTDYAPVGLFKKVNKEGSWQNEWIVIHEQSSEINKTCMYE